MNPLSGDWMSDVVQSGGEEDEGKSIVLTALAFCPQRVIVVAARSV